MATNDEAARKARADRLRAQIEATKKKAATEGTPTENPEDTSSPPAENPRDFVHRRMRELREKKD